MSQVSKVERGDDVVRCAATQTHHTDERTVDGRSVRRDVRGSGEQQRVVELPRLQEQARAVGSTGARVCYYDVGTRAKSARLLVVSVVPRSDAK